jgi:two-component system chemotaxis sensor kinase CheA
MEKSEVANLSPREQLALIFEAGLSTAKQVTAISGRGVGMDVVRSNIERIGGVVEVDSTLGQGTRMTLRVPLTLTIIPALTVSVAGQNFAIPRSAIDEIVRANGESVTLEKLGGAGVATIRGRRVPEIALSDVLGLKSDIPEHERSLVVLRPAGADVYALAVDRIHDHEELVVKPAAPAGDGDRPLCRDHARGRRQPHPAFRSSGHRPGRRRQAGGARARVAHRRCTCGGSCRRHACPAFPWSRRSAPGHAPGGRRSYRGSAGGFRSGRVRASFASSSARRSFRLPASTATCRAIRFRLFRLNDGAREIGYAFREVVDLSIPRCRPDPGDFSGRNFSRNPGVG